MLSVRSKWAMYAEHALTKCLRTLSMRQKAIIFSIFLKTNKKYPKSKDFKKSFWNLTNGKYKKF
jgi:hypothetical protein